MPNKKISELTETTSIVGSEVFPVVSSGITKKVAASTIKNFIGADTTLSNLSGTWQDTSSVVQSNSGAWGAASADTGVRDLSSNWQDTSSVVQSNSGTWLNTSSVVQSNSGTWGGASIITEIRDLSSTWQDASTTVQTNSAYWVLNGGNTGPVTIGTNDDASLSFETNNTTRIVITSGGDMGIGEPVPEAKFHVKSSSAGTVTAQVSSIAVFESGGNSYISVLSPTDKYSGLVFGGPTNSYGSYLNWNHNNLELKLSTNHAGANMKFLIDAEQEALSIKSNGYVGISAANPNERLTVNGNISSTGIIYSSGGNSEDWNSVYSTVKTTSGTFATIAFTDSKYLPLSGGVITGPTRINGNLTVFGDVSSSGTQTFANTIFSTTSALSIINIGQGPAIYVGNDGTGDIASFYDIDQNLEILHVGGVNSTFPNVGVKVSNPNKDFTVNGEISANNTIWDPNGNSDQWNSVYSTVKTTSGSYATVAFTESKYVQLSGGTIGTNNTLFVGNNVVGVNTVTPTQEFEVNGDSLFTGNVSVTGDVEFGQGTLTLFVGNNVVGVNTETPSQEFEVNGDSLFTGSVSVTGSLSAAQFFGNGANLSGLVLEGDSRLTEVAAHSGNWNSVYSTVQTNSGAWMATVLGIDTGMRALSSGWQSTLSTVQSNSATTWNYQGTDLKNLSGNWQDTYTAFSTQSANNISVYSNVQNTSGTYATIAFSDSKYFPLSGGAITGNLEIGTGLVTLYIEGSGVGINTSDLSGALAVIGDSFLVGNLNVTANVSAAQYFGSGSNLTGVIHEGDSRLTVIAAQSSNNDSVYSTVQSNSATTWNYQGTDLKNLSGNWQDTYTAFSSQSADNASVYSNVQTTSGSYATIAFSDSKYFPLSGGVIGATRVNGNLTVFGDISSSGTQTFANTVFATTSALSVVNFGTGPAFIVGQNGTGDVASFYDLDQNLEILHVGGQNSSFPNVGVKVSNPNKDFTVKGEISASNTIWDPNGNSNQWNSVYSSVAGASGSWNAPIDTGVRSLSGNWQNTYSTVSTLSSGWGASAVAGLYLPLSGGSITDGLTAYTGLFTTGLSAVALSGNGGALTGLNAYNISTGILAVSSGGTGSPTVETAKVALGGIQTAQIRHASNVVLLSAGILTGAAWTLNSTTLTYTNTNVAVVPGMSINAAGLTTTVVRSVDSGGSIGSAGTLTMSNSATAGGSGNVTVFSSNVISLTSSSVVTMDGRTMVVGDTVVLTAQTAVAQNGPWKLDSTANSVMSFSRPTWFSGTLTGPVLFAIQYGAGNASAIVAIEPTNASTTTGAIVGIDPLVGVISSNARSNNASTSTNTFTGPQTLRVNGSATNQAPLYFQAPSPSIMITPQAHAVEWDGAFMYNTTIGGIRTQQAAFVPSAPSTMTSTGSAGQMAYDSTSLYICVSANGWRKVALTTF